MGLNEKFFKTVAAPPDNFGIVLYTGTGSSQSTNSLNSQSGTIDFAPDFVWIKERDGNDAHFLQDSVRGSTRTLYSNSTDADFDETQGVTSFNSNGFTLGTYQGMNNLNNNFVAWVWYAPTAESIGASGTRIASTVKKNVDAGFSIVSYAGASNSTADTSNNGGAYWSVGHGLGATPDLVIVKKTNAAGGWYVGGQVLGSTGTNGTHLVLNDVAIKANESNILWGGSQTFNDTTFGLGGWDVVNRNNDSYIAYCFRSVDGYQKIGTYTGDGQATKDISTGFQVRFVIIKATNAATGWIMYDSARGRNSGFEANTSAAEFTTTNLINFLVDGFSVTNLNHENTLNKEYIYLAIA